jgi:formylglycine-generating enzyme required for sulfatase activity
MATIPAGWFWMGQDDDRPSNQPRHRVYLDTYAIQKTEVTIGDFAKFIAAGYQAPGWTAQQAGLHPSLPVTSVRWKDADAYCRWAKMRLPTEAEWERAARGEAGRRYPWGDEWNSQYANTTEGGPGRLVSVGSYPQGASPYGLLDMCGNAAEWVADIYDADYYSHSSDHNPTGSDIVMDHGLRGGSYASPASQSTTYFRDSSHSAIPNPRVGFRCAK